MQRMELRLVCEANRRPCAESVNRRALDPFAIRTRAHRGFIFLPQVIGPLVRRFKQIAIDPLKLAVDPLIAHDRLDLVRRRRVALIRKARALLAMQTLDLGEPVILRAGDVRRGPSGHPAPDLPVINYDDALPIAHQPIGNGETRNAGADDADMRVDVFAERVKRPGFARRFPERNLIACAFRLILVSGHNHHSIFIIA
jgi:hypothetical protein